MIRSFRCKETEKLFYRERSRKFGAIESAARRKLRVLDSAESLLDLDAIPGNRLELLKGRRRGQHSIRINDQWRICFVRRENGADNVEIVDYR